MNQYVFANVWPIAKKVHWLDLQVRLDCKKISKPHTHTQGQLLREFEKCTMILQHNIFSYNFYYLLMYLEYIFKKTEYDLLSKGFISTQQCQILQNLLVVH